jgi:hypothetical protein
VLSVAGSTIGERYRRFYFADIQAFVWRPTASFAVRVAIWAGLMVIFGGIALTSREVATPWWAGGIATLFLIILAAELVLGKTCACFVKTAVQFERLHSLGRQRTVRKVLAQLRPLIEQAQAGAGAPRG